MNSSTMDMAVTDHLTANSTADADAGDPRDDSSDFNTRFTIFFLPALFYLASIVWSCAYVKVIETAKYIQYEHPKRSVADTVLDILLIHICRTGFHGLLGVGLLVILFRGQALMIAGIVLVATMIIGFIAKDLYILKGALDIIEKNEKMKKGTRPSNDADSNGDGSTADEEYVTLEHGVGMNKDGPAACPIVGADHV